MMASRYVLRGRRKATDRGDRPTAGLDAQLWGSALSNLGAYASRERKLLFDLNDFDETLRAVRVRREAHGDSFTIAARNNGFSKAEAREATMASVTDYREAMAGSRRWARWRSGTPSGRGRHQGLGQNRGRCRRAPGREGQEAQKGKKGKADGALERAAKKAEKSLQKARSRDSLQALSKLAEQVDGEYRIVSNPPIVVPLRDITATYGISADETDQIIRDQFRATAPRSRPIGGSCWSASGSSSGAQGRRRRQRGHPRLHRPAAGAGAQDPLFLQIKEATSSVLEKYLPRSRYEQPGERVVQGQRMMQAASDIFLGWTAGAQADRHLYWRSCVT